MAADPLTSRTADELLRDHAAFDTDDEDLAQRPPVTAERDDKAVLSPRKRKAVDDLADGLADEEIKISKHRKKIPKLDTDRLLSGPGLPKMRSLLRSGELKKKLRFKGKGHEFSDTARLLNYYQMWLDNLYPRAKFADAVQLVEKAGHTKKMQMYRKAWIDEGKPGHVRREEVEEAFDNQDNATADAQVAAVTSSERQIEDVDEDPASMFFGDSNDDHTHDAGNDGPDDDELDALLGQSDVRPSAPASKPIEVDSEGEDDLDAMLAEYSSRSANVKTGGEKESKGLTSSRSPSGIDDSHSNGGNDVEEKRSDPATEAEDEDELDALLAQDEKSNTKSDELPIITQPLDDFDDNDFPDGDLDELDTLINNKESTSEPDLPSHPRNAMASTAENEDHHSSETIPELDNAVSSSPIPDVHTDELDQLMDEHDAAIAQGQAKSTNQADPDILQEFMSSSPIQSGG